MQSQYAEICLDSTPYEEQAAQLGADYYLQDSKAETDAYIDLLYRTYPMATAAGIEFKKQKVDHEFGAYVQVIAVFDGGNAQAYELAQHIEETSPGNWDLIALRKIADSLMELMTADAAASPTHSWMAMPVDSLPQGRALLSLIRMVRRGKTPTQWQIEALSEL